MIDWAIGPVWEANHVWLIFVLVVLWTGFPSAFESIFSTLFIPLCLAALGIVLRGSGFAFQHSARRASGRALAATIFGLASVLTPFFMGTVVGAIAGGRVPVGNAAGDPVTSWLNPLSLVIGALFVATCAYLSAVFLVSDARRARAPDLERYFGTRALVSAIVTGALAAAGLVVLRSDARFVFDGLKGDALPLVILSVVCGGAVLVLLRRNARRGARVLAAGAVACVIWAWGVAQHPYLLPQKLTIAAAAAPSATLTSSARRFRGRSPRRAAIARAAVHARSTQPRPGDFEPRRCTTTHTPTPCAADDGPHLATRGNGGAAMNRKQAALTVTRVSPMPQTSTGRPSWGVTLVGGFADFPALVMIARS